MKPTPQMTLDRPNDSQTTGRQSATFPTPDCSYLPTTIETDVQAGGSVDSQLAQARTFRNIARKSLEGRSYPDHLMDAVVMGSVVLAAAWPLGVLLHQLTTMMIRYK